MSSQVTCIGLGNMGAAVAQALLNSGALVTTWNRTAESQRVRSLTDAGANFIADISVAVAKNDILIICLLDFDAVYDAFRPLQSPSSLADKTLVNLTNGTPRQAQEAEAWAKQQHGASQYLDGALMATPQIVGSPYSSVLCSGESEESFSGLKGVLESLGRVQYVSADVGAAARLELSALIPMFTLFSGAMMGIALLQQGNQSSTAAPADGRRDEVKVTPMVEQVMIPWVNAIVSYLGLVAKSVDGRTWETETLGNALGMQLKGVENIIAACEEDGVNTGGLRHLESLMRRAVGDGASDWGLAALSTYMLQRGPGKEK